MKFLSGLKKLSLTDQRLLIALSFSVSFVLSSELIFSNGFGIFQGSGRLASIFVNLSLSYIAAYIFYFLTVYLPKERAKRNLGDPIASIIFSVISTLRKIVKDATGGNISPRRIYCEVLNKEAFDEAMTGVFIDDKMKKSILSDSGEIINPEIGFIVGKHITKLKELTDNAVNYTQYLDPEVTSLFMRAKMMDFNEKWVSDYATEKKGISFNDVPLRPVNGPRDVSHYSSSLERFHEISRNLEKVLENDFSHTIAYKKNMRLKSLP